MLAAAVRLRSLLLPRHARLPACVKSPKLPPDPSIFSAQVGSTAGSLSHGGSGLHAVHGQGLDPSSIFESRRNLTSKWSCRAVSPVRWAESPPQGGAAFCCPATPATSSAISRFLFEGGFSFRVPLFASGYLHFVPVPLAHAGG